MKVKYHQLIFCGSICQIKEFCHCLFKSKRNGLKLNLVISKYFGCDHMLVLGDRHCRRFGLVPRDLT